jgi:hypothetical protein
LVIKTLDSELDPDPDPQLEKMLDPESGSALNHCESTTLEFWWYVHVCGVQEVTIPRLPEEKDVQPVGHDYIEEMKSEDGKVVSFNCKLCECRFNDPNAKEMHMKVQYR